MLASNGFLNPTPPDPAVGVIEFNIANGAALSEAVDLEGFVPVGILVEDGWTAADMTLDGSVDGTNFYQVSRVDSAGTPAELLLVDGPVHDVIYLVDAAIFLGLASIKLRSGTKAAPVNQGAARVLKLIVRRVD